MSKPAVEIKGLSKAYMIGHEREAMAGTMTFRDSLVNIARKPYELFTGHQLKKEKFWALKDVNLEIQQGDVVGIIGRNGSGKSTLLKVLSRIVEPTKGEVIMRGRVASLLEVGTGFHPELTGRENVYFNGAILGMTRKEIQSKFDEIVAFSEVEKFLDTPVKFYSSGMYVRLAFAVAAHLDPDILIVDEVLAVGDAAFQKKCLGKMQDVAGQGRTVLFVSHSMESVKGLCNKGVFMFEGKPLAFGTINEAINAYRLKTGVQGRIKPISLGDNILSNITIDKRNDEKIDVDKNLHFELAFEVEGQLEGIDIGLGVRDVISGARIAFVDTITTDVELKLNRKNSFQIELPHLSPGEYDFELHFWKNKQIVKADHRIASLNISPYDFYNNGKIITQIDSMLPLEVNWRMN